jgi:hypothetical protein
MSARVFVPIVGANSESAQVFGAIAGDVAPDGHPARLPPQISELFDLGLYGIGQRVREAATRLIDARRAELRLARRSGCVDPGNPCFCDGGGSARADRPSGFIRIAGEEAMISRQGADFGVVSGMLVRRMLRALTGAALLATVGFTSGPACAAPVTLANDADVAAFAARVKAYAGASRVRWVVAAPSRADADALVANIASHLAPEDRPLIARVKAQSFAENPDVAPGASIPIAWMAPQIGQAQGGLACSWQVWVSDPDAPSAPSGVANVPLAPNDRLPVSPGATFRVGYTGLLQSKLYAFGETQPGDIRDLASAPDVNIPVATDPGGEKILLAMARQPAPFLEGIRTALSSSAGQRHELGKQFALSGYVLGRGRGIGANIQLVAPNMVVAKNEAGAPPRSDPSVRLADAHSGELMETCLFSLTPAQNPTQ